MTAMNTRHDEVSGLLGPEVELPVRQRILAIVGELEGRLQAAPSTEPQVQKVELPASLINAIRTLTESTTQEGGLAVGDAYVATVILSHGWALWERQESFDPTGVQIPSHQWEQICGLLTAMKGDDISAVNYGLSWMNQGPSSRAGS